MTPLTTCPVCLSENFQRVFECDAYPIARCKSCSHVFVAVDIPEEALAAAYGPDYYGGAQRPPTSKSRGYTDYVGNIQDRLVAFRDRLATIARQTKQTGRLLDYGSAIGLFVRAAKEQGWHAIGYERSDWAVSYGRERLGVDIVLAKPHDNPFGPSMFDTVTLWDVAEHLAQPRRVLSQVHGWLRDGGILALNTVNISSLGARLAGREWRHLAPPWHLQYYTRKSLARLLNESGFEIVGSAGEGSVIECTRKPSPLLLRRIENFLQHWRMRRLASSLNLLDEIMIIARKRPAKI